MENKKNLIKFNVDLNAPNPEIAIMKNLHEYGLVVLVNHKVPLNFLSDIYNQWKYFFSSEEKRNWQRRSEDDEGFVALNEEHAKNEKMPDFKEFYQSHSNGRFPDFIKIESTRQLIDALDSLGEKLINLIDEALPIIVKEKMNNSLSNIIHNSKNNMIRIVHYPPTLDNKTIKKSASHGDICLLTILVTATDTGLELEAHDGYTYTPDINDYSLLVFNSDMIDVATDGYLKSVTHQVVSNKCNETQSRYSIAFSIHPKRNAELKKEFTAGQFLKIRLNEMGYNGNALEIHND